MLKIFSFLTARLGWNSYLCGVMDREFNILDLEKMREGGRLEVKTARGGLPESLWETYSAFANTDGGCIVLGAKERTDHTIEIVGLRDAFKLKTDLWNLLNNRQKVSVNLLTDGLLRIEKIEGKDIIVVYVPRADRTSRPVYCGMDPRIGSYRRNGEGDYHCSLEEVSAMFRDAALVPQDAKILKEMDLSVFCQETIRAYRQIFKNAHAGHVWNALDDEIFLRRIGAVGLSEDGAYHPTAAGLLIFGYEYEILREFPQYFLDYQENRQVASTRWTDRIVSSSGDWSGNVFDFVSKVIPKLTSDLKVPFVLRGSQRVDDTPVHKIIREALTNACVHADFYGRRGLVVTKGKDGFVFANPGRMRVAKDVAVEGGVSDPRNGVMLKIFSMVNFGERAGSGLCSICNVWERVFHTPIVIEEADDVDRVILTLNYGGREQDVDAMLQLYGAQDELMVVGDSGRYVRGYEEAGMDIDNLSIKQKIIDKLSVNDGNADKICRIILYLRQNPYSSTASIAEMLGVSVSSAKIYLRRLVGAGFIVPHGANKNRTYSLSGRQSKA